VTHNYGPIDLTVRILQRCLPRGKLEYLAYQMVKQEAQLTLTNPHDAFRGQSRSPNSTTPYVRYSFLLCNSNCL